MKKIIYVLLILFLSSCATQQRYPQNAVFSDKKQKLAFLEYEMARNIILHKDYTRLPEAFKHLSNARNLLKNDPRAYYMTALAYKMRNNDKMYLAYLNKAIEKDKNFFDAYNALGIYYYEKGDYKKAMDTFTMLIKNPLYAHADVAFFNRSRIYLKLKKLKKAENDLTSALMFSGYKNVTYWENLLSLQLKEKEYTKALSNLFKMSQYVGESPYTHYLKAFCYVKLSMNDKAKEELKKLTSRDPEYSLLKRKLLKEIDARHPNN